MSNFLGVELSLGYGLDDTEFESWQKQENFFCNVHNSSEVDLFSYSFCKGLTFRS